MLDEAEHEWASILADIAQRALDSMDGAAARSPRNHTAAVRADGSVETSVNTSLAVICATFGDLLLVEREFGFKGRFVVAEAAKNAGQLLAVAVADTTSSASAEKIASECCDPYW